MEEKNAGEHGSGNFPAGNHLKSHRDHYQCAGRNEKLVMNLQTLSHIMRAQYEGRASQKRILILLYEAETVTQRNLTERLGIQPGSSSEILAKLEKTGLITRTPNAQDRRTVDIRLTAAGKELAVEAAKQRRQRHADMFACLSEEEQQTLLALLEKLSGDWQVRFRETGKPHGHGNHPHERGGHGFSG
ncbi:MAG: MarR family transcriptional regulator [Eubacteriales bacterium]|nr:MarR family transcriptional regulator [Eubacteriales bacterium]